MGRWMDLALHRRARSRRKLGIAKMWNGTTHEHKQLLKSWYENGGNAEKVETTLTVTVGMENNQDEVEEKLTIQQMKEKGFSEPLCCNYLQARLHMFWGGATGFFFRHGMQDEDSRNCASGRRHRRPVCSAEPG